MGALKKMLKIIDFMSEKSGQIGKWAAVALVTIGSYDTIMRHFFNAPSDWAYDMLCMSGGALYLLGGYLNVTKQLLRGGMYGHQEKTCQKTIFQIFTKFHKWKL